MAEAAHSAVSAIIQQALMTAGDTASLSIILMTLTEFLPPFAALLSIVWLAIRISETCSVRAFAARLRRKKFDRMNCLGSMADDDK